MNRLPLFSRNLLPLLAAAILPAAKADTSTKWNGSSRISFAGTSTLHNWSGTVSADPFVVTVITDDEGQPKRITAEVTVKAGDMNTAEPDRDANMHKDMNVAAFPLIIGKINASFDKLKVKGRSPTVLPLTLIILGKPQLVEASLKNWTLNGGSAAFELEFELSLKRCGITVPSVFLVIGVGDTIKLHLPVKLVRALN